MARPFREPSAGNDRKSAACLPAGRCETLSSAITNSQDPRRVRIDRTKNVLSKIFRKKIDQLCVGIKRTFRRSPPWGGGAPKMRGVVKSRVGRPRNAPSYRVAVLMALCAPIGHRLLI